MDIVIGIVSGIAIFVVLLIVFGVIIRRRLMSAGKNITAETARDAAEGLDEATHRSIYANLGQGRQVQAVASYRQAKKAGSIEAVRAIAALERYPQEFRGTGQRPADEHDIVAGEVLGSGLGPQDPAPYGSRPGDADQADAFDAASSFDAANSSDAADALDAAEPENDGAAFSMDDLPSPARDQLGAAVRDGDIPAAARILKGNSPLSDTAAHSIAQAVVEDRRRG